MPFLPEHYHSIYFIFGLLVVAVYAWQRFNEPTFPNRDTLPSTVDPLRHMFTEQAYRRARLAYIAISLVVYGVFVYPGPEVVKLLGNVEQTRLPAEAWSLGAALLLVGLIPSSNNKWLNMIEEFVRRGVHRFYLVPNRVEDTVYALVDSRYEPPARLINEFKGPLREKFDALRDDLRGPPNSLEHRWARLSFLYIFLKQVGVLADHPLKAAAFAPFSDDLSIIGEKYRALQQDVLLQRSQPASEAAEDDLKTSLNLLLKRIYAYISWGLGHQASNPREIQDILQNIGFKIPVRSTYRLIDVLAPAVGLLALFVFLSGAMTEALAKGYPKILESVELTQAVRTALAAALTAVCMYGAAAYIAVIGRSKLVGQREWHNRSPRSYFGIAIKAGMVVWMVICISTAISILWNVWVPANPERAPPFDSALVKNFVWLCASASPWFFVGAVASILIAAGFSGSVADDGVKRRVRDAFIIATCLGLAVYLAALIQGALQVWPDIRVKPFTIGLAGLVCGAVLGYFVPNAFRTSLNNPYDPGMAKRLHDLKIRAAEVFGTTQVAAEEWVLKPNKDLGGITPAEAIQSQYLATGFDLLLEKYASDRGNVDPIATPMAAPIVISGGRA